MTAQLLDTSKDSFDDRADARAIVSQIRRMDLLAISGGRVIDSGHGVILPVGSGYKVTIDLAYDDTYTVRRIFVRGTSVYLKGELTGVYAEDLSDVAYKASCYVNVPFGDHNPED